MEDAMSGTAGKTARRGALVIALLIGGLILLGATITAIPRIGQLFADYWNGHAGLLTAREPQVPIVGEAPAVGGVSYAGATIASDHPLVVPRVLQAVAEGLGIAVIVAASLLIMLLAVRLLRGRPFARLLSWGLGAVGVLVIAAAAVAPQLEALAVGIAIDDLGYAVYDAGHDGVFTPDGPDALELPLWDWLWVLDRVDPTLFLLGTVIAVLGLLVSDGTRLQRETEGLV